jgi:hypothetical protein
MGIPGLKICTAASPSAAYGITKSMVKICKKSEYLYMFLSYLQ